MHSRALQHSVCRSHRTVIAITSGPSRLSSGSLSTLVSRARCDASDTLAVPLRSLQGMILAYQNGERCGSGVTRQVCSLAASDVTHHESCRSSIPSPAQSTTTMIKAQWLFTRPELAATTMCTGLTKQGDHTAAIYINPRSPCVVSPVARHRASCRLR